MVYEVCVMGFQHSYTIKDIHSYCTHQVARFSNPLLSVLIRTADLCVILKLCSSLFYVVSYRETENNWL